MLRSPAAHVTLSGVATLPDYSIESHIMAGNLTPLLAEYPASDENVTYVQNARTRCVVSTQVTFFGARQTSLHAIDSFKIIYIAFMA